MSDCDCPQCAKLKAASLDTESRFKLTLLVYLIMGALAWAWSRWG
jgi:hypothetical protein